MSPIDDLMDEWEERLQRGELFDEPAEPRISDRDLRIYEMRLEGVSFSKIGRSLDPPISKQRVAKIVKRVKEIKEKEDVLCKLE